MFNERHGEAWDNKVTHVCRLNLATVEKVNSDQLHCNTLVINVDAIHDENQCCASVAIASCVAIIIAFNALCIGVPKTCLAAGAKEGT